MNTKMQLGPMAVFRGLLAFAMITAPSAVMAADVLPLSDIVSNVLHSTESTQIYSVTVTQVVSIASASTYSQISAAATKASTVQTFDMLYDPDKGGFAPHPGTIIKSKVLQANVTTGARQTSGQGSVQITVNLNSYLKTIQTWPKVATTPVILDGSQCFKLEADSGQNLACTLWVDAAHWYVPRGVIFVNGKQVAETSFQYKSVKGIWLLSRVVIDHSSDRTHVVQDFGEYVPSSR